MGHSVKPRIARQNRIAQDDRVAATQVRLKFIEFTEPKAKAVHVAGTFNGWRPEASPMTCLGDGCWVTDLHLSPGRYEYRIVVDGHWLPDLFAEEYAPNPLGGINSVLTVSPRRPIEIRRTASQQQHHSL